MDYMCKYSRMKEMQEKKRMSIKSWLWLDRISKI